MRLHSRFLLVSALLIGADAGGASTAPPPLLPCQAPDLPAGARCATYPVFENRAAGSGRTIGLRVVVVPATSGQPTEEAITFFAGGPGDSSTRSAGALARELAPARDRRDLVLVDFRGTGGSDALDCSELAVEGVQGFLDEFLPAAKVRACRERLERTRDLARYTSEEAVDDIAEVLRAYGYAKVNLYGGSYGTRAAQVFTRRHPELVRTMLLEGVVRMDERDPLHFAHSAERALEGLLAECAADAACNGAFPKLESELRGLLVRLEREPATVDLVDPGSGATRPIRLGRQGFAQTVRYMLYVPAAAAALPLQVHLAAGGNFLPIAETAQLFAGFMGATADGFYLSVTCPEDTRFIRSEEIAPASAGSFLGDFRIRAQLAACAAWKPREMPPEFLAPLVSTVPTLLVSGELDPVTPPASGEAVARSLANSLHLVVPHGGHGQDGMTGVDCLERIGNAFIAAGSVAGLDTACVAAMRRAPFELTPPAAEVALDAAELVPLVGRYRAGAGGFELTLELAEGHLRAATPGQPPIVLKPVGGDRFELIGMPAGYALAIVRGAAGIEALLLTEPGSEPMRLERVATPPDAP